MFSPRARRVPVRGLATVVGGLIAIVGVAACDGPGSSTHSATATGKAVSTATTGAFTPARLRNALLTRINGVGPATAAQEGSYASLPDVQSAARSMSGISVTPKSCAQPIALAGAGPSMPALSLGGAPAAAVSFQIGPNGVSEVLAAPADSQAAAALRRQLPAGCAHYSATSGGKRYQYAVRQEWVTGIGKQARVTSVTSPTTKSQANSNVWSVVYRGDGFVGAITVAGPNASEAAVRELAQQACAYAAQSLS